MGARPSLPASLGADKVKHLTSTTILDLDVLPEHLVVVGGSYIGLEFAQMYRRFGSKVTVIERGPRLIAHEDEEFSAAVQEVLEAEGIEFRLNAECIQLQQVGERRRGWIWSARMATRGVSGSHVLLAIGRTPNTDDLGLETIGRAVDERGYIMVDDELKTSAEGVWAMGDCNGTRRVYAYFVQRLRDCRGECVDGRAAQGERPHRVSCACLSIRRWRMSG